MVWKSLWARENNINIETNYSKCDIKLAVKKQFQIDWSMTFSDIDTNPDLRTYVNLKTNFTIAPYLCLVDDFKFRNAMSKLRWSSHNLEIERGRHTRPPHSHYRQYAPNVRFLKMKSIFWQVAIYLPPIEAYFSVESPQCFPTSRHLQIMKFF